MDGTASSRTDQTHRERRNSRSNIQHASHDDHDITSCQPPNASKSHCYDPKCLFVLHQHKGTVVKLHHTLHLCCRSERPLKHMNPQLPTAETKTRYIPEVLTLLQKVPLLIIVYASNPNTQDKHLWVLAFIVLGFTTSTPVMEVKVVWGGKHTVRFSRIRCLGSQTSQSSRPQLRLLVPDRVSDPRVTVETFSLE